MAFNGKIVKIKAYFYVTYSNYRSQFGATKLITEVTEPLERNTNY